MQAPGMAVGMQPLALSAFDYVLPPEAIATQPIVPRDKSKLMLLPCDGPLSHQQVRDLPSLLKEGDLLLFNTTKVVPARLQLRRRSGAVIDCLALTPIDGSIETAGCWRVMVRNAQSVSHGESLLTARGHVLQLLHGDAGERLLRGQGPLLSLLEREGEVPLPPYIRKQRHDKTTRPEDAAHYQSMFAREAGAVAAPTASLHFTPQLMSDLADRGVEVLHVRLHVGAGTFLPVRPEHQDDVRQHTMHKESYCVPVETQRAVQAALAEGRRVVPVGTTSLRAIETWASCGEAMGDSQLFVLPGHRFAVTSALVTNFHVPQSTLLLLVSALAGRERILSAYQEALAHGYRFLSYGDAMLIESTQARSGIVFQKRES